MYGGGESTRAPVAGAGYALLHRRAFLGARRARAAHRRRRGVLAGCWR